MLFLKKSVEKKDSSKFKKYLLKLWTLLILVLDKIKNQYEIDEKMQNVLKLSLICPWYGLFTFMVYWI